VNCFSGNIRHSFSAIAGAAILLFASAMADGAPPVTLSRGQTVYVPVYSHIYTGNRQQPFYLAATLSFRNTDPGQTITVTKIDYHDSGGRLLKRYLEKPLLVKPLASLRYIIGESDKSGGSGASFLVGWKSSLPANQPLIESVMIGTVMQQGISFTSRGVVIKEYEPAAN
jgi:hypothetical protein